MNVFECVLSIFYPRLTIVSFLTTKLFYALDVHKLLSRGIVTDATT